MVMAIILLLLLSPIAAPRRTHSGNTLVPPNRRQCKLLQQHTEVSDGMSSISPRQKVVRQRVLQRRAVYNPSENTLCRPPPPCLRGGAGQLFCVKLVQLHPRRCSWDDRHVAAASRVCTRRRGAGQVSQERQWSGRARKANRQPNRRTWGRTAAAAGTHGPA